MVLEENRMKQVKYTMISPENIASASTHYTKEKYYNHGVEYATVSTPIKEKKYAVENSIKNRAPVYFIYKLSFELW